MRPKGSPRRGAVCFVPAPRRWPASPSSRRLAADPAARRTRPMPGLGQAPNPVLDLVLADAEVIDGTGRSRVRMDVGIEGDRIAAFAPRIDAGAGVKRLDLRGLVLAPGFIDLHSHHDLVFALPPERQRELLEGRLRQGITTELVGNCGIGVAPLVPAHAAEVRKVCGFIAPDGVEWTWRTIPEWLDRIEQQGALANVATLAAHGPARAAVMGGRAGRPSGDEQAG